MSRHIFITGATGYIAKHIVLQALADGHRVTGTIRDTGRAATCRDTLARHLPDPAALDNLRLLPLDLTADDGWAQAMEGADALLHTAAPVPFGVPKHRDALVDPAVGGTERVLRAAASAGVQRVVLTSSSSAIMNAKAPPGGTYDETCWTDPDDPDIGPYPRAKTLAERAAWDMAAATGLELTAINPTVVAGPPLDAEYGASIAVFARLLKGRDPFLPRIGMTLVDVRDVATAHLAALDRPQTIGQRLFLHEGFLWATEVAALLREACPQSRVARRQAPDLLFRALGLVDAKIAAILPNLGVKPKASNATALRLLDMKLRPAPQAVKDTGRALWQNGWIR